MGGTMDGLPREARKLLEGWPVVIRLPVQWGEMDAYGHVNNVVFFRYFESARIRYLEACGFTDTYHEQGVGAILHSTSARFRRPLFHPDEVAVGARVSDLGEDRFTMEYRVVSVDQEAVAAEGQGLVVSYDYEAGRKAPLPDTVVEGVRRLRPGSGDSSGDHGT
ncbi:MAG: acyl-CoA thioesterase [Gemmatimonadota bacterium]